MGLGRANEVLLFGRKLNAQEAYEHNLVTRVIAMETFERDAWALVEEYAKLPPQSLRHSKALIRAPLMRDLAVTHAAEHAGLMRAYGSEEQMNAVRRLLSSQQKKKAKL